MTQTAVVILNWNGRNFLEKFLPTLVAHTADAEIVVADNGSTDSSIEFLEANFSSSVKIIRLDQNYGFAGGYNRALAQVDAQYFVLINSDIDVPKGWLSPLVELLQSDGNIAAVQPKILSFGRPSHFEYAGASGGFLDGLGYPFCRGRLIAECEADNGQYNDVRDIFWASGAAFAVRSDIFRSAGGFDDKFFAHMEEIDLCWRFRRMGHSIKVCPASTVFHVGAGTLPVWSPQKTYLNFRNNIAMLYKNLPLVRFAGVYCVRFGTDFLRAFSYLINGKWRFTAAIFRGHRDFWRMRRGYDKSKSLPRGAVGQIYKGSVVLYYIFRNRSFRNIL